MVIVSWTIQGNLGNMGESNTLLVQESQRDSLLLDQKKRGKFDCIRMRKIYRMVIVSWTIQGNLGNMGESKTILVQESQRFDCTIMKALCFSHYCLKCHCKQHCHYCRYSTVTVVTTLTVYCHCCHYCPFPYSHYSKCYHCCHYTVNALS